MHVHLGGNGKHHSQYLPKIGDEKKMNVKQESKESLVGPLDDWKAILDSIGILGEMEEEEKTKYIFNILFIVVKFIIELMEEGMNFPVEKLKEIFTMKEPDGYQAYFS